jgi:hypothetical protein
MLDFDVTRWDMAMVYMSPDPYFDAFEEMLNVQHVNLKKHTTAGLKLYESSGRVFLQSMTPGAAATKIPDWRTQLRGAWLIKIGDTIISSMDDASSTIRTLIESGARLVTLQFSHPEIRPNLSRNDLPIDSSAPFTQHVHDQLNNRWEFATVAQHLQSSKPTHQHIDSGGVLNMVSRVMKLTRGKLLKQPNWNNWRDSEYLQLNQYDEQGMFGTPQLVDEDAAVFHTVWTYVIKALDGRKKARFACDGSPRSGQARIFG